MRTLNLAIITGTLSTLLLLSACGGGGEAASDYAYGPLSETGMLVGTGVSLVRRGTHVLVARGKTAFYMESKTLNLQEYAGKRVHVTGTLQANVSPKYLPILSVSAIEAVDPEEGTKQWTLSDLSLTFAAPESWQGTSTSRSASFIDTMGGSGTVLTVDAIAAGGLPAGIPAVVAGNVAVKLRDVPAGGEELQILHAGQVIRLKFTPSADAAGLQHQQYEALLASMAFQASSSSSSAVSGTGSVQQPCGGPAGILCPAGQYCDVFDTQANIGKCKKR